MVALEQAVTAAAAAAATLVSRLGQVEGASFTGPSARGEGDAPTALVLAGRGHSELSVMVGWGTEGQVLVTVQREGRGSGRERSARVCLYGSSRSRSNNDDTNTNNINNNNNPCKSVAVAFSVHPSWHATV